MFDFFKSLVPMITPIFVISTMLNVGLTQRFADILKHLKNRPFVLKMLFANFVVVPLVLIGALRFTSFDPALKAGLLTFGLCAGAPFLIKLTQTAEHSIALGAAVMILLIVVTMVYTPIVLPLILVGISVNAWAIAKSLFLQMLLPIIVGMVCVQFLTGATRKVQPWVGWLGNITLYLLTGATLIGYLPNMRSIVGTGAILVGVAFIIAAFGIGYMTGAGKDHLEDVGALGTAQRNTGAAMIVAVQNFTDPNVLVTITLTNTLGVLMLLSIAKGLSRDQRVKVQTV
jgi:BASS family bile acid:Na+ symporter